MNLYLIKLTIPPSIKLSKYSIHVLHKLPKNPDPKALMVMLPISKIKDLDRVKDIRSLLPFASIVLVVPDSWGASSAKITRVIECPEKQDMRFKHEWSTQFWICLTTAIERFNSQKNLTELLQDKTKLVEDLEKIGARASQLITSVETHLKVAENVQRSLIPKHTPYIPGVSCHVKYLPAAGTGGDYFDVFEFGDRKRYGIILADSASHSMAASLLGVLIKIRIDEMKERFNRSALLVEFINKTLVQEQRAQGDLNFLYGIFDRDYLTFDFTHAGSLSPTWVSEGRVTTVPSQFNPTLGISEYPFQSTTINLKPGDSLLFHTNGLERFIDPSKLNGLISQMIKQTKVSDGLPLINEILTQIKGSKNLPDDDITLIHMGIIEGTLYLASHSK